MSEVRNKTTYSSENCTFGFFWIVLINIVCTLARPQYQSVAFIISLFVHFQSIVLLFVVCTGVVYLIQNVHPKTELFVRTKGFCNIKRFIYLSSKFSVLYYEYTTRLSWQPTTCTNKTLGTFLAFYCRFFLNETLDHR